MAENSKHNQQFTGSTPPLNVTPDASSAADLIRDKVSRIYEAEPSATQEIAESEAVHYRSQHQQFMYELSNSGKDLATIQTAWHDYYQDLTDVQKHQVWQEFYESQSAINGQPNPAAADPQTLSQHKHQAAHSEHPAKSAKAPRLKDVRSVEDVQATIRHKVSAGGKLQAKHHLQSLLFGLGLGAVVLLIFLFGFFNEVVIAPFIQPSRTATATPIIVGNASVPPSATPEVIIPKINVEIPVNYSETSTDEAVIENALQNGIVHYPTTAVPGQNGNAAFFGHSSNNIFNKGKYKFAFVLLHTIVTGDTFYLTYNSKVYVYKVISRTVVEPTEVGVLGPVSGQTATATLITCDPPGTSLRRLVVVGQQISPDPSTNTNTNSVTATSNSPTELPGNGPTLWGRYYRTSVGKGILIVILILAFAMVVRWINQPRRFS